MRQYLSPGILLYIASVCISPWSYAILSVAKEFSDGNMYVGLQPPPRTHNNDDDDDASLLIINHDGLPHCPSNFSVGIELQVHYAIYPYDKVI